MRELIVSLDAIAALIGQASGPAPAGASGFDLGAVTTLAELAGADAVRIGLREELRPIGEADVALLRRVARGLELRIGLAHGLLKPALEARPDRAILHGDAWERSGASQPLDLRTQGAELQTFLRTLDDAGIESVLVVEPEIEAVKAAHGLGARTIEIYTGATVDLPGAERDAALERIGDAARLARKLRLEVSLGGGLDARRASALLEAAPAAVRVCVGRAFVARSLLVGVDRSVRDLRAHLA